MECVSLEKTDRHEVNPYSEGILEYIKSNNTKVGYFKDKSGFSLLEENTGELKAFYNAIYTKKLIDTQQYNKIYVSGISALLDLSKSEQKVLRYIYSRLERNKDYIIFSIRECREECEYTSNQMVHRVINTLIEKKIIARTLDIHKLWINPTIMFNGDRLLMINEFIKK